MSNQKFLYVIDSLDRFGATQQLDLLTRNIAANDEVHIAILGGSISSPDFLKASDESRIFHKLFDRSNHRPSFRSLTRAGLRLRKLIQNIQPNIVHAWCAPAERVALAAAAQLPCARKFVTELYVRPASNMTMEAIDQKLGSQVNKYIVSHDEVRQSLVQHQYPAHKTAVIANAIPHDSLPKRETAKAKLAELCDTKDNVRVAGAVASLVPRSRLKDLIWATDLLTCIRNDFHFVIFGRGSQRRRLERFAHQTEAGHHVHFVDSERCAIDLIPGLDFFWQSHLNEPLAPAMAYAMRCSVPVVSVYGSGTSELITHQETGFATNFGARDEFARWTKYLLEQTDSGRQLASQGQDSLSRQFSVEAMVEEYRNVYETNNS